MRVKTNKNKKSSVKKKQAICNKCGCAIEFRQNENMNWYPVNMDGSIHFPICRRFKNKKSSKNNHSPKPKRSKTVVRTIYRGSVPPWDESLGEFKFSTKQDEIAYKRFLIDNGY